MDNNIRKLNRAEFSDAIAKGLGRAFLHVDRYQLEDVKDIVLNACLNELSYDRECCESRSKWLFSMFSKSTYYSKFKERILSA